MYITTISDANELRFAINLSKTLKAYNQVSLCVNGYIPKWAETHFDKKEDDAKYTSLDCRSLCLSSFDKINSKNITSTSKDLPISVLLSKKIIVFDNLNEPKYKRLYSKILNNAGNSR